MFAKEFDEIFHKVIKGFEWGQSYENGKYVELKSKAAFLNVYGKPEYLVTTRKFLAVLHEPEDNAEVGVVRPKGDTMDFGITHRLFIKSEGQKEIPEGYCLYSEGAILIGRAAKLFNFDNKPYVEVDYVKNDDSYVIRIKDTVQKITFIVNLRKDTAYIPNWVRHTEEEKAEEEAAAKRRRENHEEYLKIMRELEA